MKKHLLTLILPFLALFANGQVPYKSWSNNPEYPDKQPFSDAPEVFNNKPSDAHLFHKEQPTSDKRSQLVECGSDSVQEFEWDVVSLKWKLSMRYFYFYNANNEYEYSLGLKWNGSSWANYTNGSYIYVTNEKQYSYLMQNWNGTQWVNDGLQTSTYDGNGNQTSLLDQGWVANAWVSRFKGIWTFDANSNKTSEQYNKDANLVNLQSHHLHLQCK